jgi:hypothetical protein
MADNVLIRGDKFTPVHVDVCTTCGYIHPDPKNQNCPLKISKNLDKVTRETIDNFIEEIRKNLYLDKNFRDKIILIKNLLNK